MSALCGFSGQPDVETLAKMAATLRHRGAVGLPAWGATSGSVSVGVMQAQARAGRHYAWAGQDAARSREWVLVGALYGGRWDAAAVQREAFGDALFRDPAQALEGLCGAWVLVAREGDRWLVARDGAGHRALYYGLCDGRLVFGVEPKAVLAYPGFARRVSLPSLARYMAFSYSPGPETMLADVFELMPGHWLEWRAGQGLGEQRRFFKFEEVDPDDSVAEARWVERFVETLSQAMTARLPEEGEPLGVFLSGGVDSSVITAQLKALRPSSALKTFSIHFGQEYPNELSFAREVAQLCGTQHEEVLIRPKDFLPRLRQIIYQLDDPIGDPITVPNFELARHAAASGLEVIFNGEGGDPCFGGPKNLTMMLHHWYGGAAADEDPRARERAYLASYRRAYEELRYVLSADVLAQIDEQRDMEAILSPYFAAPKPELFLHKLLAINIRLKGGHLILPKVERMYGASGLVPQSPLFDEQIIRLAFEMPGTMKVRGAVEKFVMKEAYRDKLPRSVIERPKSGMRVPVHYWFQRELKRYARKLLTSGEIKRAGLFEPKRLKQLLSYETEEGPGRYGIRLWMLMTFELWRRVVVEGEGI